MKMMKYINKHISVLLGEDPFNKWEIERSIEEDDLLEPGIDYLFEGHGLEINCDSNDIIRTIFLHSNEYGGADKSLTKISLSLSRDEFLRDFQRTPEKSGEGLCDPILGEFGGYDRFRLPDALMHIQYKPGDNSINMITFMKIKDKEDKGDSRHLKKLLK